MQLDTFGSPWTIHVPWNTQIIQLVFFTGVFNCVIAAYTGSWNFLKDFGTVKELVRVVRVFRGGQKLASLYSIPDALVEWWLRTSVATQAYWRSIAHIHEARCTLGKRQRQRWSLALKIKIYPVGDRSLYGLVGGTKFNLVKHLSNISSCVIGPSLKRQGRDSKKSGPFMRVYYSLVQPHPRIDVSFSYWSWSLRIQKCNKNIG